LKAFFAAVLRLIPPPESRCTVEWSVNPSAM
jgi:hypothetical protein